MLAVSFIVEQQITVWKEMFNYLLLKKNKTPEFVGISLISMGQI